MANEVTTTDVIRVASIDLALSITETINPLLELLGVINVETIPAGTQIEQYEIEGTLESGDVTELDEVPYSHYAQKLKNTIKAKVKKYRKATTEESILKSGRETALGQTDDKFIFDVQNALKTELYGFISAGSPTAAKAAKTVRQALANVKGKMASVASAKGYVGITPIYWANPEDIYEALGENNTYDTGTYAGFEVIKNFLGMGIVILDGNVPNGTVFGTYAENLRAYAVDLSALNAAGYDYYTDETGLVGVNHTAHYANGVIDTNVRTGLTLVPEYTNLIFKGTFTPSGE